MSGRTEPILRELKVEGLTARRFEPFGSVIEPIRETAYEINGGKALRYHALAEAQPGRGGRAGISIFSGRPWAEELGGPIELTMMERHPLGTQAFVPLSRAPWLIVVADEPKADRLRCFKARGSQGVQYRAGVWHHPLLVLRPVHEFLVVDRIGPGDNLEEALLDEPVRIAL